MAADTSIEWTDKTWNPVRGCALVSPGCTNCYAMAFAHRFSGPGGRYEGLTVTREKGGPVWTGEARFVAEQLDAPLRWRTPQRVFVNSMSDLFHEGIADAEIAAVFGVMAAAHHHTFQVLTKRPERMRRWFEDVTQETISDAVARYLGDEMADHVANWINGWSRWAGAPDDGNPLDGTRRRWPLPNVWLGVSVEDQLRADRRIPILLEVPAAVRFLSCEPLLGPLDLAYSCFTGADSLGTMPGIGWVIVGGESGAGARPCALEWIESVVQQCQAAGVPVFVKQLGAYVVAEARTAPVELMPGPPESYANSRAPSGEVWAWRAGLLSSKGEALADIPEHLRVRQWPKGAK